MLLEFEDRKAVVENLVRWIRKLRRCAHGMGSGQELSALAQVDHRAAAYLARSGARRHVAPLFEGQITQEGLKELYGSEYLFYNDYDHEDRKSLVWTSVTSSKRKSMRREVHQPIRPGWKNYNRRFQNPE